MKYLVLSGLLLLVFVSVKSQDWPDWRGPFRNGVWIQEGVVEKFDTDSLSLKWSVPIGSGYTGPTVANGKVYLMDLLEEPDFTEGILCFDASTGNKLWEHRYSCSYEGIGYPAGPRASVVIENGRAYALGTAGNLACLDASTGKILWQKNLKDYYSIRMPIWGIAATPLIEGDKIILQIAGSDNACVVAFDKSSGREIWRNLSDGASYSAPIMVHKNHKKVVVVWTEHHLAGLDPETGKIYWKIPWELKMAMGIATPVWYNDYLFVSSFYNGSMLVKMNSDYTSARIVWQREGENERKTDALHCVMNTPVILKDHIYGIDSYGELRCLALDTGNRVWEDLTAVKRDRWANVHFVQKDDAVWMFNEQGELLITRLSPAGFEEISRAKLLEPTRKQLPRGVTWSHPAFAGKHVFIRNDNRLVCADLSKK